MLIAKVEDPTGILADSLMQVLYEYPPKINTYKLSEFPGVKENCSTSILAHLLPYYPSLLGFAIV